MSTTPYRTLVFATLVQESALSVGGNRPHGLVDSPLARDGRGRPVLRGSTLAGCFIASARHLVGPLPQAITAGGIAAQRPGDKQALQSSAWRFAHAHPQTDNPSTGFYQHVSIDARTLAAKDDHLFNLEALPGGTRWPFELEIVPTPGTDFATLEALAAATLAQWQQPGGARLGRGSQHGYGWCHLEDIVIVRLQAQHSRLWPDAFAEPRSATDWAKHFRQHGAEVVDLPTLQGLHAGPATPPHRHTTTLTGMLHVGERPEGFGQGYGLDTLSVGGHARMQLQAQDFFQRVIPPQDITFGIDNFDPDFVITAVRGPNGQLCPYVPGASLRGVWRAQLSRHLRAQGADRGVLDALFGSTERAGQLSVSDATLADDDWKLLWQQHVAIDELTGGAYDSAKFDRLCVARARFRWQATIVADTAAEAEALAAPLRQLLESQGRGHMPLGGGVWRGHGHITWQLKSCITHAMSVPTQGAPA